MWSFEGVAMPYNPIDLDGFSQMPILMRALVKECLENLEYVVRGNRFDEIKLLALDGQCNLPCPKFVKE